MSLTINTHPNISKVSATTPHTMLPIKPKLLRVLLQQVPYQWWKAMSHLVAQTLSLQGLLRIVVSTVLVSTKHLFNDLKPSPLMTNHTTLSLSLGPCFRVVISYLRTNLLSISRITAATATSVLRTSIISGHRREIDRHAGIDGFPMLNGALYYCSGFRYSFSETIHVK